MTDFHHAVDFLVVGSGAGGMTAAFTANQFGLNSLVIDKSAFYGGTTAISGGVIWVANHDKMHEAGLSDSKGEAMAYLNQVVSHDCDKQKLESYVDHASQMLKFMEEHSLVKYDPAPTYPDYYAELEGGKSGARSLDPRPYSGRKLGKKLTHEMQVSDKKNRAKFSMTADEAHQVFGFTWRSNFIIFKRMFIYLLDVPSRMQGLPDNRLTLGRALTGRLRKSLVEKKIPLWLNTAAKSLIKEGDNVIGVACIKDGKIINIRARKGVLIASGGFAHNESMRKKYHQDPIGNEWTASGKSDDGHGIKMAEEAGAALDMLSYAWWSPTMVMPDKKVEALIVGKSMPGCMIVNKSGKRFCNEAEPYEDLVKHQYKANEKSPSIPAYLVFDSRFRHEYPLGTCFVAGKFMPDAGYKELFDAGWVRKADTVDGLASAWGINAEGLEGEIERMNLFAKQGKDEDFARGDSLIDQYYCDHRNKPHPCLGEIVQPPFYAIELWPGDLGTKGGIKTNAMSQVLDNNANPIAGLYAAGNASASVMGDSYPGAGSTIGPAMTFSYLAAKHAAGVMND